MREEEVKSILKFGVKLVLVLAVMIGCTQLFLYGRNVMADRSNGPATWITIEGSQTKGNPSDSPVLSKAGKPEKEEQGEAAGLETREGVVGGLAPKETQVGESPSGIVLEPFLPDSEKGQQQMPETITPFVIPSDGPGNVMQAAPPLREASLDPTDGGNELFPASRPADVFEPMTAFTFNNGPCYNVDSRILDTSQVYEDRVISFIVGSRVDDHKDTLRRIWDSGSGIGDHTFSHKSLEGTSPEKMTSQIKMTNDAVEVVMGFRPKLVRVPHGVFKDQMPGLVSYPMIQWNIDTRDWSSRGKDAIAASVLFQARNGGIVLMHGLYSVTAKASETVIPFLATQDCQFATVSGMHATKGVPPGVGQVYFNIPKG